MCIRHYHPLIDGCLRLLPELGDPLADDDLDAWLDLVRVNVRALYKRAEDPAPQLQAAEPIDAGGLVRVVCSTAVPPGEVRWLDPAAPGFGALQPEDLGADPETIRDAQAAAALVDLEVASLALDDVAAHLRERAEASAAILEAEAYPSVDELEVEVGRRVPEWKPPAKTLDDHEADARRRSILNGGHYNRHGEYAHALLCMAPNPSADGDDVGVCGARCSGEHGLRGHLARGHGMTGAAEDVKAERDRIVRLSIDTAEAKEAGRALATAQPDEAAPSDMPGDDDLADAELADAAQVEAQVDAAPDLAEDLAEAGSAAHAVDEARADQLWCPSDRDALAGDLDAPCGRGFDTPADLDRHLRHAHRLTGMRHDEARADLVDEALEDYERRNGHRMVTPAAGADGTMVAPAATDPGGPPA